MIQLTPDQQKVLCAMKDPAYHRSAFMNAPLYWPQIEAIKLVEKHMASNSGKVITIRSARQTMKNECAATIHCRALAKYRKIGGTIVRTAPTHKPQIVNSKLRVEKLAAKDPFLVGRLHKKEGYIFFNENAEVHFLSAQDRSNVEGATASLLLDIDEAHKIDKGKFEEAFAPMAAWESVPIVMWGVAADKQDLLFEYREYNEDNDKTLNLQYNCDIWCELRPEYAKHVEERVKKLGSDNPYFLTQYKLVDVEGSAGYLRPHHVESMLTSDHARAHAPRDGAKYVMVVDVGGEDEDGETMHDKDGSSHDATVAMIVEVDYTDIVHDYPKFRIAQIHYWVGKQLGVSPDGEKGQQELLLDIANRWRVMKVIVDARGLGEQLASYLFKRYHNVEQYKATGESVSTDLYLFWGLVSNDRVSVWQNDQSDEYQELVRELRHTKYEVFSHDRMKLKKPPDGGHIDMVKALSYLTRCVQKPFERRTW